MGKKTVYLIPPLGIPANRKFFFRPDVQCWVEVQKRLLPYNVRLKAASFRKVPKKADLVIMYNLHPEKRGRLERLASFPKERLMLTVWEPPSVEYPAYLPEYHKFFGRVYRLTDDQIDNKKYFHFCYPQPLGFTSETVPFEEKRLATMVCGNKSSSHSSELYSARRNVIEYFEKHHQNDFRFYGIRWQYHGYANYLGAPENKLEVLKNYRFCFCYENSHNLPGYITEKIFDCFAAGCVPIYLGASNIDAYIPKNCYIHREDFESLDALHAHLKNMSAEEHHSYLDAARAFVDSPQGKLFSFDNFAKTYSEGILTMLRES